MTFGCGKRPHNIFTEYVCQIMILIVSKHSTASGKHSRCIRSQAQLHDTNLAWLDSLYRELQPSAWELTHWLRYIWVSQCACWATLCADDTDRPVGDFTASMKGWYHHSKIIEIVQTAKRSMLLPLQGVADLNKQANPKAHYCTQNNEFPFNDMF